jgi:hypothetical protein
MPVIAIYNEREESLDVAYLREKLVNYGGQEGLNCAFAPDTGVVDFILDYSTNSEERIICITPKERLKEIQKYWKGKKELDVKIFTYQEILEQHEDKELEFLKKQIVEGRPSRPETR